MINPEFMKTYPQAAHAASSQAAIVEIPARGSRPTRRGAFWPGENFAGTSRKWDLSGAFENSAFVLPALVGNRGPQTL